MASTLVHDAPERKGPLAQRADDHLARFLDIVMRLETSGGAGIMTPEDEDQELRTWADLREYQLRFAQSGGFLGNP